MRRAAGGRLPLAVGVTAANTHDKVMFVPLIDGIPAIRSRRGPRRRRPDKLHADKGYDYPELRAYCRRLGIAPRIARCFAGFLSLAATLVCFKRLAKLTK